uniref:Transcription repressor n=1 Tax=Aegilops tauschii TaxID=37682 RepID=M8BFK6_AEGTA
MKAMILRRRGAGGGLRITRKGRGFMCGCGGSKAVSVSDGSDKQSPMATPPTNTSTATTTTTMSTVTTTATRRTENAAPVAGCASRGRAAASCVGDGRRHRRTASEGGGRRVEESVAVVKESADPLADFRRSMLQMIVEKEIVGGADLRELLHRFLSLNSPHHHHLILRAFAEIWEEVFSGYERTPDFLVSHSHGRKRLPAANSLC